MVLQDVADVTTAIQEELLEAMGIGESPGVDVSMSIATSFKGFMLSMAFTILVLWWCLDVASGWVEEDNCFGEIKLHDFGNNDGNGNQCLGIIDGNQC